jgi:hypothetical protein
VANFCAVSKGLNAREILADSHYLETLKEHATLPVQRLTASKGEAHAYFKQLLVEGKLILPNNPRLLTQLREVSAKATVGGTISISIPRKATGGHGDLVSALVAAVWAARGGAGLARYANLSKGLRSIMGGSSLENRMLFGDR